MKVMNYKSYQLNPLFIGLKTLNPILPKAKK